VRRRHGHPAMCAPASAVKRGRPRRHDHVGVRTGPRALDPAPPAGQPDDHDVPSGFSQCSPPHLRATCRRCCGRRRCRDVAAVALRLRRQRGQVHRPGVRDPRCRAGRHRSRPAQHPTSSTLMSRSSRGAHVVADGPRRRARAPGPPASWWPGLRCRDVHRRCEVDGSLTIPAARPRRRSGGSAAPRCSARTTRLSTRRSTSCRVRLVGRDSRARR
jgi:hypothetical protein